MTPEFWEKFALLIIDKVIIAGIAFWIWRSYSKRKEVEREKEEQIKKLEEAERALIVERKLSGVEQELNKIQRQIDDFYWPMNLCMKTDDAIWSRVPSLYDDGTQLPTDTGKIVEKEVLIPNHRRAVEIIQSNFHLVGDDSDLSERLVAYIRHVAVYRSLRLAGAKINPIDVDEPFPEGLSEQIDEKLGTKIERMNELSKALWTIKAEQDNVPDD